MGGRRFPARRDLRLFRNAPLLLLCHKLHAPATTYWTAGKLLDKGSGNLDAEGCDGIRVMPLGSNPSPPAAGTGEVALWSVSQDGRRGLRGKNGSFPRSRSRKPQCTEWHGDEIPASCGLRNVPTQVPI